MVTFQLTRYDNLCRKRQLSGNVINSLEPLLDRHAGLPKRGHHFMRIAVPENGYGKLLGGDFVDRFTEPLVKAGVADCFVEIVDCEVVIRAFELYDVVPAENASVFL